MSVPPLAAMVNASRAMPAATRAFGQRHLRSVVPIEWSDSTNMTVRDHGPSFSADARTA